MPQSGSDSSQYAVLTSDKARSEFRSGVGNAHKDSLRMTDWADYVPKTLEEGNGK